MVKSPVQAIGLVFLAKDCPLTARSLSVHCDLGLLNLYQCHMFGKIFARPHNASMHLWTTQDVENVQECMRRKRTAGPRPTLGRSAFGIFQTSKLPKEHEDCCGEPKDHRHGA
jgi:hypothetical protein